ncbi:MAG: hypothetical protein JXR86_13995 [Spirochaetales bacterium]|nr:hypothetical protein [Spirochaetales bacterium]
MKEKISLPGDLIIRQETWSDSPCSRCSGSPCCSNLPLAPLRLSSRKDFVDLLLLSTYGDIFPGLKPSGEWTVYLKRACGFLQSDEGKCAIHGGQDQSMICKSYDSHNCWYIDAFNPHRYTTMIPFSTSMLIQLEKDYQLIKHRFDREPDWDELCRDAFEYRRHTIELPSEPFSPLAESRLPFKKSRGDEYLFFQPYEKPSDIKHFELMSFRLGFPGVYLAVSDTSWAYLVKAKQNTAYLNLVRDEYFPGLAHKDSSFSFDSYRETYTPHSGIGDQWVILRKKDLPLLKSLTEFGPSGQLRRLPAVSALVKALETGRPDRAA